MIAVSLDCGCRGECRSLPDPLPSFMVPLALRGEIGQEIRHIVAACPSLVAQLARVQRLERQFKLVRPYSSMNYHDRSTLNGGPHSQTQAPARAVISPAVCRPGARCAHHPGCSGRSVLSRQHSLARDLGIGQGIGANAVVSWFAARGRCILSRAPTRTKLPSAEGGSVTLAGPPLIGSPLAFPTPSTS